MKKIKINKMSWFMLISFVCLIGLLGTGLSLNPGLLPSKMISKPFPEFELDNILSKKNTQLTRKDIIGRPALVHVWATWCGVCLNEHSTLLQISHRWSYPIYSILYQDSAVKAQSWLSTKGNPYKYVIADYRGQLGVQLGVYGTPETYVIDSQGIIHYRWVGPLDMKRFENEVLPILKSIN